MNKRSLQCWKRYVLLLAVAANPLFLWAQDLKAPLPTDPKVIKGKLPNGLTYYIRPNGKPEQKVELRLAVNTGSILEDDDQQGLAHFMEHMNFNGTKNFQKNDLVSYLQSIGVQFGADLNAYTSFDETVYILPIPTDKPGNLDKGFQIIEDWAHNALLTDKDINEERGVVLEESRLGKGAEDRMMKKYLPKLLNGSKYANRLPIGKDDILKNFKPDVIRRFYKDWYRPDLQAVAISGDIDSAKAMKYLMKHFAPLANPASPRPRTMADVPARTKAEAMVLTDKEATNYQLMLIFPTVKKDKEKTLGDYKQFIERQLVLDMINTRLADLVRSSNPPFPFAAVSFDGWARGYENLSAFAVFGDGGPRKALDALTAEMVRAKQFGFTQSELELAKKKMMANIEKSYNERNTTESGTYVDEYVRNFLEDEPMPGIENEYQYYQQFLPMIKLEDLSGLMKSWMNNTNTFTLLTGPEKNGEKLPTDAELLKMTQDGLNQTVQPMEEKQVASSLLKTEPVGGKVVSQAAEEGIEAVTYTLSNGAKVTIKQTNFKSDEILLKGIRKGGTNTYGVADKNEAKFATAVAASMGFGDFTPSDLDKVMSGKTASVRMSMDEISNVISGNSSVKDFQSMLQLLYLRLTAPRKDEALFKAFVDKQKSQLQFMSANPQVAFFDTTITSMYGNNPLAPSPFPKVKDFENLKMARALEIYQNEFGGADGYHFFLVGNVDPQTAIPLLERYIGGLPTRKINPGFKDNGVRPVAGVKKLTVKKGQEKQSMIFAMYNGETNYSDDFKLKAMAVAEILNIKVIEELREKLGGIYTGGFFADVDRYPYGHYTVGMQLPCGPENVDKLLTASQAEIKTIKEKGPDEKDLSKVKNQMLEEHRTNAKENRYWSEKLLDVVFWGNGKKLLTDFDNQVNSLTTKDLQQMAQILFNGKNEFVSVLYPEK